MPKRNTRAPRGEDDPGAAPRPESGPLPGPGAGGDAPERPALALLREIKEGKVRGRSLSQTARRDLVGALIAQGGSVPEIALSLGVSDRTVQRDLDALRREHGARVSADFVLEVVGALRLNTQSRLGKLDRIGSDSTASAQDRIRALRASHRTELEYIHRMQTLGMLPHAISERLASRGPSSIHLHQHNGVLSAQGSEQDEFALLKQGAESLERMSALAERSSGPQDAAVAKRARTAAKRVKNTASARRDNTVGGQKKPSAKRGGSETSGSPGAGALPGEGAEE